MADFMLTFSSIQKLDGMKKAFLQEGQWENAPVISLSDHCKTCTLFHTAAPVEIVRTYASTLHVYIYTLGQASLFFFLIPEFKGTVKGFMLPYI